MKKITTLDIDARQATRENITVRVQVKKLFWVRLGLIFIKIGCKISGANYVEEFPVSLMQNNEPVEMDKYDFIEQGKRFMERYKNGR